MTKTKTKKKNRKLGQGAGMGVGGRPGIEAIEHYEKIHGENMNLFKPLALICQDTYSGGCRPCRSIFK